MSKPKVILLNGFAGSGKTTIARLYINDHPLTVVIEGDELIVNIGDWLNHEEQARELVFEFSKEMIKTALGLGHDVIVPYLVLNAEKVAELESLALECNAIFIELYLSTDKQHAIERLLKRGTWGEIGAPPITNDDLPIIQKMYSQMEDELPKRPQQIHIKVEEGSPMNTYHEVLSRID